MPKPSVPYITIHAIMRFQERFCSCTDEEGNRIITEMVARGEKWGPSGGGDWHLLAFHNGEPVVMAMKADPSNEGRPMVTTILTLDQAIANQKRAFKKEVNPKSFFRKR